MRSNIKLTLEQELILEKMEADKWYNCYDLGCSFATLLILHQKGRVSKRAGLGSSYSPRVNITFQKLERSQNADRPKQ